MKRDTLHHMKVQTTPKPVGMQKCECISFLVCAGEECRADVHHAQHYLHVGKKKSSSLINPQIREVSIPLFRTDIHVQKKKKKGKNPCRQKTLQYKRSCHMNSDTCFKIRIKYFSCYWYWGKKNYISFSFKNDILFLILF